MRRVLANLLFVFLGLPLALSALLLVSVRPWALDRETYRRFALDDRLYLALQAPEIAARTPESLRLGPASYDGPALVAALQKNLPLPEIKSTATRAIDATLDAVESGAPGGSLELDLRLLKTALKAKSPAIARDYAAALAARGGTASALPVPRDTARALSAVVDASIPDSLKSGSLASTSGNVRIGIMSRGPDGLSQALLNRMTASTMAISALLLAGLGALGGTNAISRLSRAGKYLLLPSVIVLVVGAALAIPGGLILQNVLPQEVRGMLEGSGGAQFRDYLASALGPIARSFFVTGLVGASLGGVLLSMRRIVEPKELE